MAHSEGFLSALTLVPPSGAAWPPRPPIEPASQASTDAAAADGTTWPLFWHEPPWHLVEPAVARAVASAVAGLGIGVSCLASELAIDPDASTALPVQIVPYRADRYGLQPEDFAAAAVLEVRLAASRDAAGRFAYSARQMQRWLGQQPPASATATAAATPALRWPPELRRLQDLAGKLDQLRRLAPQAACFVTIDPFRLGEELPAVIGSGADGVVLRLDECELLPGAQIAQLVVLARQLIARGGKGVDFPLWVVPPQDPTADDCVKLMALGASAVAIDFWCSPLLLPTRAAGASAAAVGRPFASTPAINPIEQFGPDLDRLAGLMLSCGAATASELSGANLTTADQQLAIQLGIGWLLDGTIATAPTRLR